MNENRRQILQMLADGRVTADEAERLIAALEKEQTHFPGGADTSGKPKPKYLRVMVESVEGNAGTSTVNVRVPMQLLRAGVKLAGLIPAQAREHVNEAMREHGMAIDLNQIKPENLEELVDQLNDLTVDVDQKDNKVRVFCE